MVLISNIHDTEEPIISHMIRENWKRFHTFLPLFIPCSKKDIDDNTHRTSKFCYVLYNKLN